VALPLCRSDGPDDALYQSTVHPETDVTLIVAGNAPVQTLAFEINVGAAGPVLLTVTDEDAVVRLLLKQVTLQRYCVVTNTEAKL
jgi:hypothetical protein